MDIDDCSWLRRIGASLGGVSEMASQHAEAMLAHGLGEQSGISFSEGGPFTHKDGLRILFSKSHHSLYQDGGQFLQHQFHEHHSAGMGDTATGQSLATANNAHSIRGHNYFSDVQEVAGVTRAEMHDGAEGGGGLCGVEEGMQPGSAAVSGVAFGVTSELIQNDEMQMTATDSEHRGRDGRFCSSDFGWAPEILPFFREKHLVSPQEHRYVCFGNLICADHCPAEESGTGRLMHSTSRALEAALVQEAWRQETLRQEALEPETLRHEALEKDAWQKRQQVWGFMQTDTHPRL